MPHDKNGAELKTGDRVTVEFVVTELSPGTDHCNLKADTVEPMHPGTGKSTCWFNTKQVAKAVAALLILICLADPASACDYGAAQVQRQVFVQRQVQYAPPVVVRQQAVVVQQAVEYCPPPQALFAPQLAPAYVPQRAFSAGYSYQQSAVLRSAENAPQALFAPAPIFVPARSFGGGVTRSRSVTRDFGGAGVFAPRTRGLFPFRR